MKLVSLKNGHIVRIKICGITQLADALLCEKEGANALGFIFYPGSKRYIDPAQAKKIISELGPFIDKVGVFVNESVEKIEKIIEECGLTMVQLHGEETPGQIKNIDVPVIKGFRVDSNFNYKILDEYRECFFMLDAFSDTEYGGSGKSFNWHDIPVNMRSKIILAGGISVDNLEKIFTDIKPAAIDLSSSIEISPGIKDPEKVRKFCKKFRDLKD
jgi:phosphoribosylanthranilate isomerase